LSQGLLKARLESLGYDIVSESASEVVAVQKRAFTRSVPLYAFVCTTGTLSRASIEADLERVVARARELDAPSGPAWLQGGRIVVAVYVANKVDPDAQRLLDSVLVRGIGDKEFVFLAALDRPSGSAHYIRETPSTGGVTIFGVPGPISQVEAGFYARSRHVVQNLIDPANAQERVPVFVFVRPSAFWVILCLAVPIVMTMLLWVALSLRALAG
jgi:hypothetical protein